MTADPKQTAPQTSRTPRGQAARSKRMERGDASRELILDAASRLMASKGYSGTSISDIQKESGFPASSIYWHFTSKAGVLAAVMERGAQRYFDEVVAFRVEAGLTPPEHISAMLAHSAATVASHPEFLRLFMVLLLGAEGDSADLDVVARVRDGGRSHLHTGLRLAFASWGDEVATIVADELAEFSLSLFDGIFVAMQADDPTVLPRLLGQHCDALLAVAEGIRIRVCGT